MTQTISGLTGQSSHVGKVAAATPETHASQAAKKAPAALASLQAQLAQYQHQLSDCVNCASSQTAAGKEQIQEISGKISAIQHSLQQASQNQPTSGNDNAEQVVTTDIAISASGAAGQDAQNVPATQAVIPGVAANLTSGVYINTFS